MTFRQQSRFLINLNEEWIVKKAGLIEILPT